VRPARGETRRGEQDTVSFALLALLVVLVAVALVFVVFWAFRRWL
jgi:hypothetical protein